MDVRVIWAVVSAGIFLNACAMKDDEAVVDIAAAQQAIKDRSAAWMQAVQAKDAASVAGSFYSKEAMVAYDGSVSRGRAAIQAGLENDFASSPETTVSWTSDAVNVAASGDMAYETGTITRDPDGAGPQPAVNGAFVTVWRKIEGEWYAVADAGTEAAPPAGEAPPT
jgi:uncharacterized protein (TIGR02246 family)